MRVIGLSFSGHGSSICLVEDGRIVHAMNLERLTRTKFALATLPGYLFEIAGVLKRAYGIEQLPPLANFYEAFPDMLEAVAGERTLEAAGVDLVVKTHDNIQNAPGNPAPYEEFCRYFEPTAVEFDLEHHLCHAYQAYLASPFDDTAILTVDGRGEDLTRLGGQAISMSMAVGEGARVEVLSEVYTPSSLGAMYAGVTSHLGFREEQEGNTMALAAFGTDRFHRMARADSFDLLEDGRFELRLRATRDGYNYLDLMREFCPPREPGTPFTQDHYDLAWGFQDFAEEILVHAAQALHDRTGKRRLAMAGGVSLNCVANAQILRKTPFEELYVMPNAGDRGLAVGSALYGYHVLLQGEERHPPIHDYLGRPNEDRDIVRVLEEADGIEHERFDDIALECARLIASGRIIGWVQGGAEFGPRALGHRSILGDPRSASTKERLDQEIKRREWFRPYAPSVLAEYANDYFEMLGPSPYMLVAVNTRPEVRDKIPGIVHADGSARVQTVDREVEPRYHRLISNFHEIAGVPLVLNTSFNGYGDPMVETPGDALAALLQMSLDAVAIGDHLAWPAGRRP